LTSFDLKDLRNSLSDILTYVNVATVAKGDALVTIAAVNTLSTQIEQLNNRLGRMESFVTGKNDPTTTYVTLDTSNFQVKGTAPNTGTGDGRIIDITGLENKQYEIRVNMRVSQPFLSEAIITAPVGTSFVASQSKDGTITRQAFLNASWSLSFVGHRAIQYTHSQNLGAEGHFITYNAYPSVEQTDSLGITSFNWVIKTEGVENYAILSAILSSVGFTNLIRGVAITNAGTSDLIGQLVTAERDMSADMTRAQEALLSGLDIMSGHGTTRANGDIVATPDNLFDVVLDTAAELTNSAQALTALADTSLTTLEGVSELFEFAETWLGTVGTVSTELSPILLAFIAAA